MPANRIQPRTWFVQLRLSARDGDGDTPSDADVPSCIKDILDLSNNSRTIRGLQHVSFAYSVRDPTPSDLAGTQVDSNMVDVVGFAHSNESILDTTMHSWIQDSRVMDQRWTPVSVTPGSNWMQTDIIKNFFADCEGGRRVSVDWLWSGDASKGGRPKRRHRGPDTGEISRPQPSTPAADILLTPLPLVLMPPPPPVIFSNQFSPVILNPVDRRTTLSLRLHCVRFICFKTHAHPYSSPRAYWQQFRVSTGTSTSGEHPPSPAAPGAGVVPPSMDTHPVSPPPPSAPYPRVARSTACRMVSN